jgi:beta-xylosidase
MSGNSHNLSSPESPALLVRKQTAFRQKWKVLLNFKPKKRGSEAGVVVWLNRYSYCAFGIHVGEEGRRVVSMTRPDDDEKMGREMVQVRSR